MPVEWQNEAGFISDNFSTNSRNTRSSRLPPVWLYAGGVVYIIQRLVPYVAYGPLLSRHRLHDQLICGTYTDLHRTWREGRLCGSGNWTTAIRRNGWLDRAWRHSNPCHVTRAAAAAAAATQACILMTHARTHARPITAISDFNNDDDVIARRLP